MAPYPVTAVILGGLLTVVLRPEPFARRIKQVRVTGPAGSSFGLYLGSLGQQPFDATPRGDSNLEDYSNPVLIPRGYAVYGQWSTGVGAATATFTMERDS